MADKDIDTMMRHIAPLAEAFIAVRPDYPRALDARSLAKKILRYGAPVTSRDSIFEAVEDAISRAGKDGIVCALGSLYFSGEVRMAHGAVIASGRSW